MDEPTIIAEIARLSDTRRQDWDKPGPFDPDNNWVDFVLKLPKAPSLGVIEALLRTFDDALDDGGTQESVCGYLSEIDPEVFGLALSRQTPHLRQVAPVWLEDLTAQAEQQCGRGP